jgi:hypothetical protein
MLPDLQPVAAKRLGVVVINFRSNTLYQTVKVIHADKLTVSIHGDDKTAGVLMPSGVKCCSISPREAFLPPARSMSFIPTAAPG